MKIKQKLNKILMENGKISVITSDNKKLFLDERIINWSPVLQNACLTEEIQLDMINSKTLGLIYDFYKKFGFQVPDFKREVISNDLKIVLNPIFFDFFIPFITNDVIDLDKIKPIVDGCYYYDFKELKDLCLMAIGSAFFFKGSSLEAFKSRWNVDEAQENLTSAEKFDLITDYENVFNSLLEKYLNDEKLLF